MNNSSADKGYYFTVGFFVGAGLMVLLIFYLAHGVAEYHRLKGYRQGQIDAMQGKIRYRPVARVEWEEAHP